ncbi:MAG: hypothetical protein OXC19_19970 [Bryobacterales bacterium]|nr:hypothetical protein [Bryobacterales bacterium]
MRLCAQANVAHTFLYVDNGYGHNGVALEQFCNCVQELEDWGYDAERKDDITMPALFADGWTPHVHATDFSPEVQKAIDLNVKGSYVVLRRAVRHDESFGPKRLALLYVIGDGHIAYDAIYCQGDGTRAPYLIVVQDHGAALNFERGGLLEQFAYQCSQYPEWLLVGSIDTKGTNYRPWDGYTHTGVMPELQGAAKNPRKLYRRAANSPFFLEKRTLQMRRNETAELNSLPTLSLKHEVHDILNAKGGDWMRLRDVAECVKERALYQSRTNSTVTQSEIFEVSNDHGDLFVRRNSRIRRVENG